MDRNFLACLVFRGARMHRNLKRIRKERRRPKALSSVKSGEGVEGAIGKKGKVVWSRWRS
eukprot:766639-Hanusia_phi.AAC.1